MSSMETAAQNWEAAFQQRALQGLSLLSGDVDKLYFLLISWFILSWLKISSLFPASELAPRYGITWVRGTLHLCCWHRVLRSCWAPERGPLQRAWPGLAWPRHSVLSRAEPSRAVAAGGQRPLPATRRSRQHRGEVRRWGLREDPARKGGGEQGDLRNRCPWHRVSRVLPATSSLSQWDGIWDERVLWLNPEILVQYGGN